MTILSKAKTKDILTKLVALQIIHNGWETNPAECYMSATHLISDLIYEVGGLKSLEEAQDRIFGKGEAPNDGRGNGSSD